MTMTREDQLLHDPNYYRLAYQLAAQLVHHVLSGDGKDGAARSLGWILSRGRDALESREVESASDLEIASREAKRVLAEASATSRDLTLREDDANPWRFWRPGGLSPSERRLKRFLLETVVPGTRLLLAGVFAYSGDTDAAHREANEVRSSPVTLSYRAQYNLACFEASVPPYRLEDALEHLRQAFVGSSLDRRPKLVDWAEKDPSLKRLRDERQSDFAELIATFKRNKPKA